MQFETNCIDAVIAIELCCLPKGTWTSDCLCITWFSHSLHCLILTVQTYARSVYSLHSGSIA